MHAFTTHVHACTDTAKWNDLTMQVACHRVYVCHKVCGQLDLKRRFHGHLKFMNRSMNSCLCLKQDRIHEPESRNGNYVKTATKLLRATLLSATLTTLLSATLATLLSAILSYSSHFSYSTLATLATLSYSQLLYLLYAALNHSSYSSSSIYATLATLATLLSALATLL